jgi:hypothetical protein
MKNEMNKYRMAFQDINRQLQLSSKLKGKDLKTLMKLKRQRISSCHYECDLDENTTDINNRIRIFVFYNRIANLQHTNKEIKKEIDRQYPNLINAYISILPTGIVSKEIEDDIHEEWNDL